MKPLVTMDRCHKFMPPVTEKTHPLGWIFWKIKFTKTKVN